MATDLNSMNLPGGEYELFDPENAWPGATGRVVVQVNKMRGGAYQIGTGETGSHWIRSHAGGAWGEWQELVEPPPVEPPPPPEAGRGTKAKAADEDDDDNGDDVNGDEADDEYRTTDMKPKRGPGRPRKY